MWNVYCPRLLRLALQTASDVAEFYRALEEFRRFWVGTTLGANDLLIWEALNVAAELALRTLKPYLGDTRSGARV